VLGFPAQGTLKFVLAGDEDGGITGPARQDLARNLAAGDFFGGVQNFQDGEAAAISDIEGFAGDGLDRFEGADVGICYIEDVDVIADAGAIGSRIIRAENFDVRNDAHGGLENARDEMGFDAMVLAALGGCAGGIEIAERGEMETGVGTIVGEDFLEAELGFAVGIDGIFGMILGDGDGVRFTVGGSGGREDEFVYSVASDGVEKIDPGGDIGGVESAGLADGFGDERLARKMHDCVDLVL